MRARYRVALATTSMAVVATVASAAPASGSSTPPPVTVNGAVPVASLPAPPAGFSDQLTQLYGAIYGTVAKTGVAGFEAQGTPPLPSPDTFDQTVASLDEDQLKVVYRATSGIKDLGSLIAGYQALEATVTPISSPPPSVSPGAVRGSSHGASVVVPKSELGPFPPQESPGSFPPPAAPYVPSLPVQPAAATGLLLACPNMVPGADYGEAAITAANLSAQLIDIANVYSPDHKTIVVYNQFPITISVIFPNPIRVVLSVLGGAAHITADTLAFQQSYWTNCTVYNTGIYLANIDNTAINVYYLSAAVQADLGQLQTSVNDLSNQVGTAQQTVNDELALSLQESLDAPTGTPPLPAYELPASDGGYLDSTPLGVQELVTHDLQAAQQAGLAVNPAAVQLLAQGNAALAAGHYQQAFSDYRDAYQDAAR